MKERNEGTESSENAGWRGLKRAQACCTARRARGGSTPCDFAAIGVRSRSFMNSAGYKARNQVRGGVVGGWVKLKTSAVRLENPIAPVAIPIRNL